MKKLIGTVLLSLVVMLLLATQNGWALPCPTDSNLALSIDGGDYIDPDPDAWIHQSCVTSDPSFTLNIHVGNFDLYDVTLIIAVPDGESGSVSINGNPLSFGPAGQPPEEQPHGVYPTPYDYYSVADFLSDHSSTSVEVVWSGYSMVHFDAFGCKIDPDPNGCTPPGNLVDTPNSHDATATGNRVPEPATLMLMGIGLVGFWGLGRRKRR
jgi:hypothetical protein